MKTQIIAPQATSVLNNGVLFSDGKFFDKYNNELSSTWVCFSFWTNENSKFGCDVANDRLSKFCAEYGIENRMY